MSTALTYDLKEMLFGIEITLVSGFVFFYGFLTNVSFLWGTGLIGVLFGLWLSVDAYTESETTGQADSTPEVSDEAD